MKYFCKTLITLAFVALAVSGCLSKTAIPENDSVISESDTAMSITPKNTETPTETQRPTKTISPTVEPSQTKTSTSTPLPSITPTITPQPTKDYFKDAVILNIGYLGNNQLLIVVETISELKGEYFASIGDAYLRTKDGTRYCQKQRKPLS